MPPVILHFVAAQSESGKTTLVEKLLPVLKNRGFKVAAFKGNLAHYDLDEPGKDSWRFARAGAEVAGITNAEGFILTGLARESGGLDAAAALLKDFDLLIVEGDKKSKNPKIEVVRSALKGEPLLTENTIALATDRHDLKPGIPVFDINDIDGLADFIKGYFFDPALSANGEKGNLTHFDRAGRPRMVDVSEKARTAREAYARGEIIMAPQTLTLIESGRVAKGDVLGVAQVAAIMAVKETSRLIPMAHPLEISAVETDFNAIKGAPAIIEIGVRVRLTGQTGVEMEALTGVSVAALTIYDMCKAVDKNMIIRNIRLVEKKGGRTGHYRRE